MATNSELLNRLRMLSMNVATIEAATQRCARELESLVELATLIDRYSLSGNYTSPKPLRVGQIVVDRATFSVRDGTRLCELGNTVCFRLFECLASQAGQSCTRDQIMAVVWEGHRRAATTVRSAFFQLRSQLRRAGMGELADAIHSEGRAYCLRFDATK
jgi:DNA-binding response OmpR family regulator